MQRTRRYHPYAHKITLADILARIDPASIGVQSTGDHKVVFVRFALQRSRRVCRRAIAEFLTMPGRPATETGLRLVSVSDQTKAEAGVRFLPR